ncbi:MAG: ATP-binding protein [Nitrospirota bacterium]
MPGPDAALLLLSLIGVLAGAALAAGVFMLLARARRKRAKGEEDTTRMGFVVDTFHSLVAALKEKEKELEALRKAAEKRAEIIEDHNENILQSVPSGVLSLDGQGRVLKANASAERVLGWRAGELGGREAAGLLGGEIGRALREKDSVERGEARHVTAGGKELWLGYTLTPLRDSSGNAIGKLLVFTDLTDLKALREQAELRKHLSNLGEMAAGIAHELRNPMGVIHGYMSMLGKKVDPSLSPIVSSVSREVAAMDAIIRDFLSFARPREPDVSEVNVRELLEECASSVLGEGGDVELVLRADSALAVEGDQVLLRQALTNLADNAVHAMGGRGRLSLTARAEGSGVLITVSDTGHGIPRELREKIFLPFYTTKEKGTGLGLALVHRIVSSHGGAMDVSSGEEGTTFTVSLPRRRGPAQPSPGSVSSSSP